MYIKNSIDQINRYQNIKTKLTVTLKYKIWNSIFAQKKKIKEQPTPNDFWSEIKWEGLLSSDQWSLDPLGYGHVSSLGHVSVSQRVQLSLTLDISCSRNKKRATIFYSIKQKVKPVPVCSVKELCSIGQRNVDWPFAPPI